MWSVSSKTLYVVPVFAYSMKWQFSHIRCTGSCLCECYGNEITLQSHEVYVSTFLVLWNVTLEMLRSGLFTHGGHWNEPQTFV